MKEVIHVDEDGRKSAVLVPDSASENEAQMGILVGPPSLEILDLPKRVEVRLHNQLFERRLFTLKDVLSRHGQLMAAMLAAFKPEVSSLAKLYRQERGD